jgi:hypothetical protein
MIAVLIDALLLLVLLKLINNGDRDFVTALVAAIAVSILTPILIFAALVAIGDPTGIGDLEMMSAVILSMAAVAGVALLVLGVDLKKSLLAAVMYTMVHFAVTFGLGMLPTA